MGSDRFPHRSRRTATRAAMPTLPWSAIDTVLLDMDGTLLDLHFDNHFWLEHLPQRYAERNGLSRTEADAVLEPLFREHAGQAQLVLPGFLEPGTGPVDPRTQARGGAPDLAASARRYLPRRPAPGRQARGADHQRAPRLAVAEAGTDRTGALFRPTDQAPTTTATRRRTRASGAPCKPISASTRSAACSSTTACRSCAAPAPMVSPICWRYATRTAVARSGTPRSSPPRRTTGGCSKDCRSRGNENPATRAGLAKRRDHSGMRRTWPG